MLLTACNPLKKIPEGQFFLSKNKIVSDSVRFHREDLTSLQRQKTNRRILGIVRLHLGIYTVGNTGDTSVADSKGVGKFWKRVKRGLRKIGEEPVILDTALVSRTQGQLELYLQRKGYFDGTVTDSIRHRRKRTTVTYSLHTRTPYFVRTISYSTADPLLMEVLKEERAKTVIDSGEVYDADLLDQERDRLTASIRDRGYYFFNRNFITYELDSSLGSHQVDIYLYINRLYENVDDAVSSGHPVENHHQYNLNDIFIYPDFDSRIPAGELRLDTTLFNEYYFLERLPKEYIRKDALLRFIFMRKGNRFYQKDVDYTFTRLADLNIFKFVNFRFEEVKRDSLNAQYLLDVHLQLTPLARQEYKVENEFTHNGGNLGIAGSLTYQNKNIFRGAELLELKLSGGFESLRNFSDPNVSKRLLFFNTFDFGPELSLGFKKFLIPGFIERRTSRYFNPKTVLSVGANYQNRPDFIRTITKFSFGYQWRPSSRQRLQYYPFEVNSVKVKTTPSFAFRLLETLDASLIYSYLDHLITSGRFGWEYTNQGGRADKNYFFLRSNFEMAGNTLYWYSQLTNASRDTSNDRYTALGNIFSQYVKPDMDFTFHMHINQSNKIVYRLAGGIGITYGNSASISLPFDKSFFVGGANDIRAWQARSLGPGSYIDPYNIENGGDIKLEANVEYRSAVFKQLEVATFVDAGNVWLLNNKSTTLEGSLFDSKKFLSEIAVGVGLGLRYNFNFFILRADFGLKMVNPELPASNRWVYSNRKFVIGQVVPNLAIGYPF